MGSGYRLFACALMTFCLAVAAAEPKSEDYLSIVTLPQHQPSRMQVASNNVMSLNSEMMSIYEVNLKMFQANLLRTHPVILALFSSEGGSLTLYRPGQEPLNAPPVPSAYTQVKAVAHSPMAIYQYMVPHASEPGKAGELWRAVTESYLKKNEAAFTTLGDLDASEELKSNMSDMLQKNIAFLKACLKNGNPSLKQLGAFTKSHGAAIHKSIAFASKVQVEHWVGVLTDWKAMLGTDFDKLYAVSNTRYVTKRRNVLFTVLAQFLGEEAINTRLLLFGTTDFQSTPEVMLSELTRVVADRAIGELFFSDNMQMDVELMGEGARAALKGVEKKLPKGLRLPPLDSTHSHAYPWSGG